MQKIKHIKEKKTIDIDYIERKIKCDICKKEITEYYTGDGYEGNFKFINDEFGTEDKKPIIGVTYDSYNYGDSWGNSGEIYDICYDCYCNKIKPLLKEKFNIEPRDLNYDE